MRKYKKLYDRMGMALLSLPSTKADRTNNKRRNVGNLDATSSAHVISVTGIRPEEPILFCGRYNKAIPMIRQLIKQSERPFVFVGTKRDLNENSCLCLFETQWEYETPLKILPEGNGKIVLESGAETNLALKNFISNWDSHFIHHQFFYLLLPIFLSCYLCNPCVRILRIIDKHFIGILHFSQVFFGKNAAGFSCF